MRQVNEPVTKQTALDVEGDRREDYAQTREEEENTED